MDIAKNDSSLQRPILKRRSGFCTRVGRFLPVSANFTIDLFIVL